MRGKIIGVFDDHLAALKQAMFLPEFRRQADAAICLILALTAPIQFVPS